MATLWERFEHKLEAMGSSFEKIKGTNDENLIIRLINDCEITKTTEIMEVVTEFRKRQAPGFSFSNQPLRDILKNLVPSAILSEKEEQSLVDVYPLQAMLLATNKLTADTALKLYEDVKRVILTATRERIFGTQGWTFDGHILLHQGEVSLVKVVKGTRAFCAKVTKPSEVKREWECSQEVWASQDCPTVLKVEAFIPINENKAALITPMYPITLHEYIAAAKTTTGIPRVTPVNVALCGISTICAFNTVGRAHCDLKPQNLCLGMNGVVVAIDYGSSLKIGEEVTHTTQYWYPGRTDWRASASWDFHALGSIVLSMVVDAATFKKQAEDADDLTSFRAAMKTRVNSSIGARIGLLLLEASDTNVTPSEVWEKACSMVKEDPIFSEPELVALDAIFPKAK